MQPDMLGEVRFLLGVLSLAVGAVALGGYVEAFRAVGLVLAILAAIGFFLEPGDG